MRNADSLGNLRYGSVYPDLLYRYPIFAAAEVVASLVAPMGMFAHALYDEGVSSLRE